MSERALTPHVISHYRIIKKLGAGGMGEVFLAQDTKLDRQVAIKFLAPKAIGNEQAEKRLIREARAAATLDHPNICTVHEVGEEGDRAFIVMQFVEGETLSWRLHNAPPSVQESVDIAAQVADALVEAHSRGVVHRDIKPQNLIITPRGQVKVLDFGLAKWTPETAATNTHKDTLTLLTDPGMVIGTVRYMSPEQIRGENVDARSDLFALGGLLYECVTGKPAFTGSNSMDICAQVIHVDPRPPSELNPEVPPQLERVISKALAKNSAARYQSASEMLADLRKVKEPSEQTNSNQPERESQTLRTRIARRFLVISSRRTALRAGLILAVLIVALAMYLWPSNPRQANREATRWYEIGMAAMRDGTFYQASKALGRALEFDTRFVLAHARLAEAYLEIDDVDKAKDELLAAVSLVPNRNVLAQADASYLDAIEATVRRDFAAAVEHYRQIAEQAPDSEKARAYLDLGRSYEKNENLEKAIENYIQATTRDRQLPAAYLRLGILFGRQQKLENSAEAFKKAEELYQGMSNLEGVTQVFYERGALLNVLIKVTDARAQLEKALELAGTTGNKYQQARALLQLSSLSWSEANPERAKQYASEAIGIAKDSGLQNLAANGLIDLGGAYYLHDEYDEAEKFYKQALDLAQKHRLPRCEARALMALGSLDVTRDSPEEAMPYIEKALAFYEPAGYGKETSRGLVLLGRAKRQKGDHAGALQIFGQQLQLATELGDQSAAASAHLQIGYLLGFYQEQYPLALSHFEESTALDDKMRATFRIGYDHMNRGRLLSLLGRYHEARSALDQAKSVASQPGDNTFKELLAWVYMANAQMALTQERFAESKSKSQQAVNLAERHSKEIVILSRYTLGQALALTGAPQAATQLCEDAIQIAKEAGNPQLISSALLALAEVTLRNNDGKRAVEVALEAQAGFERSGQQDSEWHAWLIAARASQLAGDESAMYQYASRAASLLSKLEERWGAEAYKTYLSRPDIHTCRKQINQMLAYKR